MIDIFKRAQERAQYVKRRNDLELIKKFNELNSRMWRKMQKRQRKIKKAPKLEPRTTRTLKC